MGGKKEIYQYIRFFHGALQLCTAMCLRIEMQTCFTSMVSLRLELGFEIGLRLRVRAGLRLRLVLGALHAAV